MSVSQGDSDRCELFRIEPQSRQKCLHLIPCFAKRPRKFYIHDSQQVLRPKNLDLPLIYFLSLFAIELEPCTVLPYDMSYEENLYTVHQVKDAVYNFISDMHRKSGVIPLCLNTASPVYRQFQS